MSVNATEEQESDPIDASGRSIDTERLAELYALLSRPFEHPDGPFVEAVNGGRFETALRERTDPLSVTVDPPPSLGDGRQPREAYLSTFESFDGPYASPVESVYKEWWDGTKREITAGPAAHDMRRRYEAIDAEIPAAYPPDHVALLLEYGSLLLEAGDVEEYARFHGAHFDWIPEFVDDVERTADSAFYQWAARTLETVLDATAQAVIDHE